MNSLLFYLVKKDKHENRLRCSDSINDTSVSMQCLDNLDLLLMQVPELQIRGGIEDNSNIIFLISKQKHVVAPHCAMSLYCISVAYTWY